MTIERNSFPGSGVVGLGVAFGEGTLAGFWGVPKCPPCPKDFGIMHECKNTRANRDWGSRGRSRPGGFWGVPKCPHCPKGFGIVHECRNKRGGGAWGGIWRRYPGGVLGCPQMPPLPKRFWDCALARDKILNPC